jgi:hypothetical protein
MQVLTWTGSVVDLIIYNSIEMMICRFLQYEFVSTEHKEMM